MVGVFPNETSATTLATEISLEKQRGGARVLKRYPSLWISLKQAKNRTPDIRDANNSYENRTSGFPARTSGCPWMLPIVSISAHEPSD